MLRVADAHRRANHSKDRNGVLLRARGLASGVHGLLKASLILAAALCLCAGAQAQEQGQSKPAAPVKVPRVTTTVVVHDEIKNDYLPLAVDLGELDGAIGELQELPLSVTAVNSALLKDQGARVLADAVKNDASIGEDYAPVGYYGDFQIRGFPIDLATGLQINGMTIAGEQDVPLENKERIEFLKGIAGVESGVASAGGEINYVTKRMYWGVPRGLDLATDHRGGSYGALDFASPQRFKKAGVRINLAGEEMRPYVQHAGGWRGVGAADGSWQIDGLTTLLTDFEFQHRLQRSEAGLQLLGGTTVPMNVFPSTMLGYQPWGKPNTFDVFNAGTRLLRAIHPLWTAKVEGSYSHSLIDDNVIWPYGAALDANGNSLCPNAPAYFFCPDGSYEIYDYRSPGELRINATGEATVQGKFKVGGVENEMVAGGSIFHRTVDLSSSAIDAPIGVEFVNQPDIAYASESPRQAAGPSALADFNRQSAGLVQERAVLPGGVVLLARGRYTRVSDFNYAAPRSLWLPQYAATYTPHVQGKALPVTLYANYGVTLSLGPQASWWVDNANQFLDPFKTRQTEAGVKYEHGILLTADYFRMRQPFFYPKAIAAADNVCTSGVNPGDLCFEQEGRETHDGFEANAQGKAAEWMQLNASVTAMRATAAETGTAAFDHQQVINNPRVRTAFFADLAPPHLRGLHLMPGWSYTGRKEATRDDTVSVGGYNLFNLGARYTPGGAEGKVTLRVYADNVLDKRYWKDTGANYGDTFIHLGAPTTVKLSAHYTF
jgi:iron complex outermembrane receptor protein